MAKKSKVVTRPFLPITVPFCLPGSFLDNVVDILCDPCDGLFDNAQNDLKDIYADMRVNINKNLYKIYPLPNILQSSVNTSLLVDQNGKLIAGHDLPVWLSNSEKAPNKATHRIMIIACDPRRNKAEMTSGGVIMDIGISSPFGVHSGFWRSKRGKGVIPSVINFCILDKYEDVSVYVTDAYKLRKADGISGKSTLDKKNIDRYKIILKKEIELFKPTLIILLGNHVQAFFKGLILNGSFATLDITHPSGSANGKWAELLSGPVTDENKMKYICEKIAEKLNKTFARNTFRDKVLI